MSVACGSNYPIIIIIFSTPGECNSAGPGNGTHCSSKPSQQMAFTQSPSYWATILIFLSTNYVFDLYSKPSQQCV